MPIKFYFNFISSGHGRKEIDEPIGFDAAGFNIKQDSGRWGRDVVYSGNGEAKFSISPMQDHCFELMMYNRVRYGFEAIVKLEIDFGDGIEVVGDIDFKTMSTNGVDRCEFTVVQESTQALFKRRYDNNVDLFSFKDLDGNTIEPCQTVDMLLKAKPIVAVSEWTNPIVGQEVVEDNPASNADYFNVIKNQVKYDIKDSLTWLVDYNDATGGAFENFAYIQAATNLKNVKIEFTLDALYKYRPQENNSAPDKNGQILLRVYYGQSNDVGEYTQIAVWNSTAFTGTSNQQQQLPTNLSTIIPFVNATERIWISFVSATKNGAVNRVKFNECKVKITATGIALNTVIPVVRYIDAIKYAVKSASGLDVIAPRWEYGGEFYEQYITTAQLMRNLRDKPFNITNKDIVEDNIRPEVNGDYEIQADDKVFYGLYEDFYRNYEMGNYPQMQFEDYNETTNDRYTGNTVRIGFKSFASNKEAEQDNTLDIVHGDLEGLLPNKNVEDKREASAGFIRDAFLMEQTRQKAYDLSDNTATSDDSKTFIIDAVTLPSGTQFTETAELQHEASGSQLILKNTGSFSWLLLGIASPDVFTILNGENQGSYAVSFVSDTQLTLLAISGTPEDVLVENTTFKYSIRSDVRLTNRTNEGFTLIDGIEDGENYANLRFTTGRILRKYYNQELATHCFYRPNEPIRITKYSNNPDARTQIAGEEIIREGGNFTPTNPILTPNIHEMILIMPLSEYWRLQGLMRSQRGYIRTWDSKGLPVKEYISEGEWTPLTPDAKNNDELLGAFKCTLEEKYVPYIMEIIAQEYEVIINNEIIPAGFTFSIDDLGYLSIFDQNGKLLHVPVLYDRVRVNNSAMSTPEALGALLSQYDRE